eukprot:1191882-Prorocentrum_minimum.AAC.3
MKPPNPPLEPTNPPLEPTNPPLEPTNPPLEPTSSPLGINTDTHSYEGLNGSHLRHSPLGTRESLGRELNSPVVERLNKGLMAVWSPNSGARESSGGEPNSPVGEHLIKGSTSVSEALTFTT